MKFAITLFIALFGNWLLWSGHFDNAFLLGLGFLSCIICLLIAWRMRIVDEEGAPAQLGLIRPFLWYAPWLIKEIVRSNMEVAKIILSPVMPLRRKLFRIPTKQQSAIGRVIFANSITLTPGTVAVHLQENEILIHGLNLAQGANEVDGEMGDRICQLERGPLMLEWLRGGRPSPDDSK